MRTLFLFSVCHSPTAPYFGSTRSLELLFETSLKKATGEGTSVRIRSWFTLARPTLHVAYKLYEKAGRGFPTGPWKSSYLFRRNAVVFLRSIGLLSLASDFLPQAHTRCCLQLTSLANQEQFKVVWNRF